jgi:hypothetical protein
MPIATNGFLGMEEAKGLTNSIGNATTNIKFVTVDEDTFKTDPSFKTNGTPVYFVLLSL